MPTPLDRAVQSRASRSTFLGFAGLITAVAAWSIWGQGGMFPKEEDPKGDPDTWTEAELRRWLNNRSLFPSDRATREDMIARVRANMRQPPPPPSTGA